MTALAQPRKAPPTAAAGRKTIPFDYVFEFDLQGVRGNRVQDVVNFSIEGVFVAHAVGYSFVVDERTTPRTFDVPLDVLSRPPSPHLAAILIREDSQNPPEPMEGPFFTSSFSLPPSPDTFAHAWIVGAPGTEIALLDLRNPETPPVRGLVGASGSVLLPLTPAHDPPQPQNMQFGPFLQPLDLTRGVAGPIVEFAREGRGTGRPRIWTPTLGPDPATGQFDPAVAHVYGTPGVAFDGDPVELPNMDPPPRGTVELLRLRQGAGSVLEALGSTVLGRLAMQVPGGHLVTGYRAFPLDAPLQPGEALVARYPINASLVSASTLVVPGVRPSDLPLGAFQTGLAAAGLDLTRGFRLAPEAAPLLEADLPLDRTTPGALNGAFLTGCSGPEAVSFLYQMDVVGSGRELQSEPVHNLAGLGSADGDRPFRPFARPIAFAPRSTLRIQVDELSGPAGRLTLVLQGYKILGSRTLQR